MGVAFQIVSIILIIGAVIMFRKLSSGNIVITNAQKILSVFQIVLCGYFFAICLSDVLDIKTNFSSVRLCLNIFYALAFLALTAFALSDLQRKKQKHIQIIVCCCAALIAVQCFIFPYSAETEFIRICEAVEGIVVFTMLIMLVTRINDKKFSQNVLVVIVLLELAIAVLNTALPMTSIAEDVQGIDIPMNYMSLYMRPVIFSSLTLVHRVWIDLHEAQSQNENI